MNNPIKVRRYQSEDLQDIVKLFYNTVHTVNAKDYNKDQLDVWAPVDLLHDCTAWKIKLEKSKPFVVLINDKIVGFSEFESNGHIDCFYVHHEFQGMGVGSALIQAIFEEAQIKSISCIYSEVSITAKPFFEAQGFATIEQQNVIVRGIEFINFKMEKIFI
jgi:putative acetyltransferase